MIGENVLNAPPVAVARVQPAPKERPDGEHAAGERATAAGAVRARTRRDPVARKAASDRARARDAGGAGDPPSPGVRFRSSRPGETPFRLEGDGTPEREVPLGAYDRSGAARAGKPAAGALVDALA